MKTLAIIPACEGSAVLPNKNMRIINGKPMIFYVINNAKHCKYIDDIIVTSNSSDIITLAKQMKVLTRKRDSNLSSSSVSLDVVIKDVFNQLDFSRYDIVVTLQSISPLLKVTTLNSAFEFFISSRYDTLISVKSDQHFFWKKTNDELVPLYPKRINRHQLSPLFVETGAFLITKSQFIKADSRIGKKVGLYELFEDEAIDVNNFGDLRLVENAMKRKSAAIYVNGNNEIGLGHISRVFQIADELFTKPDIYFDKNITSQKSFQDTKYNLIPVDGNDGFVNEISKHNYDIIINDILNTSLDFMNSLKRASPYSKIVNFEDEGSGAKIASAVINALYEDKKYSNFLCGHKYFIISKLFLLFDPIKIKKDVKNVIVTFGGADPMNFTKKTLDIIISCRKYSHFKFYVVLGKANKNTDLIIEKFHNYPNIKIFNNIDNIAELMSFCDAAISSRGRTCFELASLGIPTLSIPQHSREKLHTFVCTNNGFICANLYPSCNEINNLIYQLLTSDKNCRMEMQRKMLKNDLRNGRKFVADVIQGINLEGVN